MLATEGEDGGAQQYSKCKLAIEVFRVSGVKAAAAAIELLAAAILLLPLMLQSSASAAES